MPYKAPLKLVHCPFNSSHVFCQDRLQAHVIKCEKNYPSHFVCPFYRLHRFLDEKEYQSHLLQCDRKKMIEPWLYMNVPRNQVKLDLPPMVQQEEPNWE